SAEALSDNDVGKVRLLIGIIKAVDYKEEYALISIERKSSIVTVKFEEAFFANSPNYIGLFHNVQRLISNKKGVVFTGI
ncbi:hypothetical protein R0K18_35790, partial [Pantoea sp. SIMBA_133]